MCSIDSDGDGALQSVGSIVVPWGRRERKGFRSEDAVGRRGRGLGVFDYTSKSRGPSIGDGRRGFGQSVMTGGVSVGGCCEREGVGFVLMRVIFFNF